MSTLKPSKYIDLQPFQAWVQQSLPAIYDDSLSYTDLLAKMLAYLNNLVANNNTLSTDMKNAIDYINNYFDNLDVQDEINKKLDKMAEDGTLSRLIQPLFDEYKTEINAIVTEQNNKINQLSAYVTPEMFGAKGDGITDDTQAIKSCLETGNTIVFASNKTYYIGKISLPDVTSIKLYGNNSSIKGGPIILNVNENTNQWVHPYRSGLNYIAYLKFYQTTNNVSLHLGFPIEINSINFTDCDTCIKFTENYIDRIMLKNIEISNFSHEKTDYSIICPSLSDETTLYNVHDGGTYVGKTIFIGQNNSAIITQCLNISVGCNAKCMITFNNCHFEGDCTLSGLSLSNVIFNNCYMWGFNMLYKYCHYNNCMFAFNKQTYNKYHDNGIDITDCYNKFNNCVVAVSDANNLDFSKFNISRDSYDYIKYSEHNTNLQVNYPYNFDLGKKGLTGTYKYTIFGCDSNKGLSNTSSYNVATFTRTLENQGVGFSNFVKNKFIWIYRENPDGTIQRSILPPSNAGKIFDLGDTMNGFKWVLVNDIVKPTGENYAVWNGFSWSQKPISKSNDEYYLKEDGTLVK